MVEASETLARAAGVAGRFAATMIGFRGVFRTVAGDHAELRVLMSRLIAADAGDRRRALFDELRRQLRAHHRAEEAHLYPVMARIPATREVASRGLAAHRDLERRLDALAARDERPLDAPAAAEPPDAGGDAWLAAFVELAADLEDHFADEERHLLWPSRDLVDDDHAEAIEALYEQTRRQALRREAEDAGSLV